MQPLAANPQNPSHEFVCGRVTFEYYLVRCSL